MSEELDKDQRLKGGVFTMEFWLVIAANVVGLVLFFVGELEGQVAATITTVATAGYAWVRGELKKRGADMKHIGFTAKSSWKTSEFWMTVVSNISSIAMMVIGGLDPEWGASVIAVLNTVYAFSRGKAKSPAPDTQFGD